MEKDDMLAKLDLIEEQARLTLEEFPQQLKKDRQRAILALVRQLRWVASGGASALAAADPEATVKLSVS